LAPFPPKIFLTTLLELSTAFKNK